MTFLQACEFRDFIKTFPGGLGLRRMRLLMGELSQVQNRLKVIHVAGTNGKGSVCAMVASVLQEAGYVVGRYHSPVVFDEREVFLINGACIGEEEYAAVMEEVSLAWGRVETKTGEHPSSFEVDTALAFLWFYQKQCDYVVLETGLGGRDDATNVGANTLISAFTSISMDHMEFLGNTIEKIAQNKAGIIKPGAHVITGPQLPSVERILQEYGEFYGASFFAGGAPKEVHFISGGKKGDFIGYEFSNECYQKLKVPGYAKYQTENASLAVHILEKLRSLGGDQITGSAIRAGIASLKWEGRMELINSFPQIFIDGAHNKDGAKKLRETLEQISRPDSWIMVFGVMRDKEYMKIMEHILPFARAVYTVTPENERSLPAKELAETIQEQYSLPVFVGESVEDALKRAYVHAIVENKRNQGVPVRILAFGSLYYLKEVKSAVIEMQQREN